MDKQALLYFDQVSAAAAGIEFENPAVALPEGMQLHDLEKFRDTPIRQRSTFTTQRTADFVNYVKPEAGEATAVFVSADGNGATAVIDYGTHQQPQWKEHRAVLKSQFTPAFDALRSMANGPKKQREITNWIEDWHELIEACDESGAEIQLSKAIAAIRRVDIKRQRQTTTSDSDMSVSKNSLDSVSASSGDQQLPAFFRVTTPMFEDLSDVEFRVRLSLRSSDDVPSFGLRIISLEQIKRGAAEEIEMKIRYGLPNTSVFVGTID